MAESGNEFRQLVHELNFCPCRYIDTSWLESGQPWLSRMPQWRQRPALNQWVLEEWQLKPVNEATFNLPYHSLALLPPEALAKLVLMIGGVLHCQAMRHVVLKAPRQHLNTVFGSEGVSFCMTHGPMLVSGWPAGWQQNLGMTFTPELLTEKAEKLGRMWLAFLFLDAPPSLEQRLRFKLRRELAEYNQLPVWLVVEQRDLAYRLTKKIAKQVIPQWFHLLK